ncbi:hypothetical protein JCM19231_2323 [Vibrio ishigakensis]|uniref:Uncharacterized protein n=1 Tax=Vibrio ishigakensis TaxID=1481914 RepID=A0A0B8QG13_9VIBR|nr:hypothetical protein JCM19231_2323 [Vibrio ishigakensis]GAM67931.1 hypothetical protein JCM19236_2086 [Vibrio sp. JCM 19236]GAM74113.1 hypothetical protein JCM19241_5309 [Vibrio ishigakensis]
MSDAELNLQEFDLELDVPELYLEEDLDSIDWLDLLPTQE